LLARLIGLVETNSIHVPLYASDPSIPPGTPNSVFLNDFLVKLMKSAFPHLAPYDADSIPFLILAFKFKYL